MHLIRFTATALAWVVVASFMQAAIAAPDDVEPVEKAVAEGDFNIDESNFDQWVFQGNGNASAGKERLKARLNLQVAEIDRLCGLTSEQKNKLLLAARGDTKRFFDQVEEVRKKFLAVRQDQNAFNNIWQDIQPLQRQVSVGLHGETSLFYKSLQRTLTEEQLRRYREVQDERRKYRYRASIEVVLTNLENSVPLKHAQHAALVKLILEETSTPIAFGQYDQYLIMHQLSKLGEAKVKPLLDERQWTQMKLQFDQARGMEPFLIQQGLLPKDAAEERIINAVKENPADARRPENVVQQEAIRAEVVP
ncbi:MAG TPA: hypothetical protein VFG20_12330 [Planctomycetaceae bacterium]|nr:hypothetical protein [Planctomycetaceae bacterium]